MMYGTGVGAGLSVFLLSTNLHGVARQLPVYQALVQSFAGILLCGFYYVETLTDTPLVLRLTHAITANGDRRLASAFVVLQVTSVVLALFSARSAVGWLEKFCPPTDEQDLARPRFLTEHALADPESALDLAEKEQLRLLGHLTAQLDTIRAETQGVALPVSAETWHRATIAVSAEVQAFLHELTDRPSDHATSERLLALERRQTHVVTLDETIFNFVTTFATLRANGAAVGPFLDNLAESLNTLVLTALDALRSGDATDRELILGMTADRGDLMERLRRHLLTNAPSLDHQQKAHLFYLTSLFERAVWLLRQLGLSQQSLDRPAIADTQS
jgi:phosphate:Na+ symporter